VSRSAEEAKAQKKQKEKEKQWRRRSQEARRGTLNSSGVLGSTRGPRCTTRGASGPSRQKMAALSLATPPRPNPMPRPRSLPSFTPPTMSRSLSSTSISPSPLNSGTFLLPLICLML